MPGYSLTPLLKKLGIKPTHQVLLVCPPEDYFKWLDADITEQVVKSGADADCVHVFVQNRKALEQQFARLVTQLKPDAFIWVSW